jgi:ORF6N domain
MSKSLAIHDEEVINKIYLLRGKRVMLDRDLADMYGVETLQLKRQVRRNLERFPKDFMFELDKKEFENLRSQFGTSSWGGVRYTPMAFTEQGVAMLSSILNSKTAIEVNIQIIRIFTRIREMLITHKDVLLKLEKLEKAMLKHDNRTSKNEDDIQLIFNALKQLLNPPHESLRPIGFKIGVNKK